MTTAVSPMATAATTPPRGTAGTGRFYIDTPQPLLWEKFGLYGRLGQVYDVKLYPTHVSVVKEDSNGSAALEVLILDIVGCQLMKCKDPNDSSAYFI